MKFKSDIELQAGLEDASGSLGTVNQLLSSTVTGTAWIDPSTIVAEAATVVVIACKNTSGATIAKGTPVYQTGTVGATATIEIAPADALISTGDLPAIGLLQTALNNNGFGFVVISGALTNFTTSPIDGVVPVTGDKVFLKSGGGLTLTKPTGSENGIQNLGLIGKVSTGASGSITVSSIMRTNDVPNLPEGRIWVGDGNTIVSDTVYVDEPNNRVGIGTTAPGAKLDVEGDDAKIRINNTTGTIADLTILDLTGLVLGSGAGNERSILLGQGGNASRQAKISYSQGSSNGQLPSLSFFTGDSVDSLDERMRIDSAGNVGIGTDSPRAKLDIRTPDPSANFEVLDFRNTGDFGIFATSSSISSRGNTLDFKSSDYNSGAGIQTRNLLSLQPSGNVGIGTDSPVSILDLNKQYTASGLYEASELTLSANNGSLKWATGQVVGYVASGAGNSVANFPGGLAFKTKNADGVQASTPTTKMVINSAGNVGIGTTNPNTNLEIVSTSNTELRVTNDSTIDHSARIQQTDSGTFLSGSDTSNVSQFVFRAYGDSYINGGNVGIGTTSPDFKLDVAGSIRIEGDGALLFGDTSTSPTWGIGVVGNDLAIDSTISGDVTFINSGNVGIGTTSPSAKLHIGSPEVTPAGTAGTVDRLAIQPYSNTGGPYIFKARTVSGSEDYLDLYYNTSQLMSVGLNGNVGIGTTSPAALLHIKGNDPIFRISNSDLSINDGQTIGEINFNSEDPSTTFNTTVGYIKTIAAGNFDGSTNAGGKMIFGTYKNVTGLNTAMAIDVFGNVGIGTTSPTAILDIKGGTTITSIADFITKSNTVFTLANPATKFGIGYNASDNPILQGFNVNGAKNIGLQVYGGNVGIGTDSPGDKLVVQGDGDGILVRSNDFTLSRIIPRGQTSGNWDKGLFSLYNAATESVRIDTAGNSWFNGGNVGIGTTSPQSNRKLDVAGHIQGSQNLYIGVAGTNLSSNSIEVGQGRTGNGFAYMDLTGDATYTDYGLRIIRNDTGANASSQIVHRGTGDFSITTSESADILLIPNSGNVGIGTTSPQAKLDVAGGIRMSMDTSPADSTNVGTLRYYSIGNSSYVDMCMQTSATAYAWVNIVQNNW